MVGSYELPGHECNSCWDNSCVGTGNDEESSNVDEAMFWK